MFAKYHISLGIIFSIILLIIWPELSMFQITIIFLSSILIDVDHYLFCAIAKKDLSLKNAYGWFINIHHDWGKLPKEKKKKFHGGFVPFHSMEFLGIILLLTLFSKIFILPLIGFTFHLATDLVYEVFAGKRAVLKISLIYMILFKKFIGFDFWDKKFNQNLNKNPNQKPIL